MICDLIHTKNLSHQASKKGEKSFRWHYIYGLTFYFDSNTFLENFSTICSSDPAYEGGSIQSSGVRADCQDQTLFSILTPLHRFSYTHQHPLHHRHIKESGAVYVPLQTNDHRGFITTDVYSCKEECILYVNLMRITVMGHIYVHQLYIYIILYTIYSTFD